MDVSQIRPLPRLVVHGRSSTRQSGGATAMGGKVAPATTSPTNGVPPPVNDVITISDKARSEFQAWLTRQSGQMTPATGPGQQAETQFAPPSYEAPIQPEGPPEHVLQPPTAHPYVSGGPPTIGTTLTA